MVEASDGGQVTVHLIQDLQITSAFVEFIAHVNPDLTVRELTSIGLGDNFGTNAPCRSRILTALFFFVLCRPGKLQRARPAGSEAARGLCVNGGGNPCDFDVNIFQWNNAKLSRFLSPPLALAASRDSLPAIGIRDSLGL